MSERFRGTGGARSEARHVHGRPHNLGKERIKDGVDMAHSSLRKLTNCPGSPSLPSRVVRLHSGYEGR